jgi:hypothetical protein
MRPSLEVDFAGIILRPFHAFLRPANGFGRDDRASFEEGWGGAVAKTLAYDVRQSQNVQPRIHSVQQDGRIIGFSNSELGSRSRSIPGWKTL